MWSINVYLRLLKAVDFVVDVDAGHVGVDLLYSSHYIELWPMNVNQRLKFGISTLFLFLACTSFVVGHPPRFHSRLSG